MNLSPKQQEIVNTSSRYCCVIAGAGSGKTRTLTERIRKLLLESKSGEKILAITFSNKAANELNDRLLKSYTSNQLNESVYVGTIHNFCMELVLQRGPSIGLSPDLHIFESVEDRMEIFKEALDYVPQLKQKCMQDNMLDSKRVRDMFEALSKAKRNFLFPADYAHKPLSQMLYQEYNNRMLAQNAIDFDDILLYSYIILTQKEAIAKIYQRIYKHICIDEAQDLNKAQYQVIKTLAGTASSIFMVGDPSQAIYGFNGSASRFMCIDFPIEFCVTKFTLAENYRSSRAIIYAAKQIEPSFEMEGQLPILGECTINKFPNEDAEAVWIIEKLNTLLQQGHPDIEGNKIDISQCAVLARNKYVFSCLEKLLKEQNIEYYIRASANQGLNSESTIFKIFDLGLRLLMNPKDILHFSEMHKVLGINANSIASFSALRHNKILGASIGDAASTTLNAVWDLLQSMNTSFRFNKILDYFYQYCNENSNFDDDNERLLTFKDYAAWAARWETYIKSSSVDNRNLPSMMRSIALGITAPSKEKGLTLSTVHMSKGLEFDVVFIMGLNEGTFPDYRSLKDQAQLDEEQHNMFVSITRSKRLCYLTYPLEKIMPWGAIRQQLPSRYLTSLQCKPSSNL